MERNEEEGERHDESHDERHDEGGEDDDNTCCHRATFCNPIIREILVTNAISTCLGQPLTWAHLFWMMTVGGILLIGWAVLYFLLGETMLPNGSSFGLFLVVIVSYLLGWSLTYIPYLHLPPVFGMLLAGLIIRNTDFYNIQKELGTGALSKIRTFCLTFIMIRAGLQLTTTALRKHPVFIMILALVPCSVEILMLTISCKTILGYPWDWAFMTGTIVGCMSPVVTANCMLSLAEQGYGEDKGLATLLYTAATIDDVHVVSLFSICYSSVFGNDRDRTEWWSYIPSGLRDLLLGLLAGIILGSFLVFFPHRNHKHATKYRVLGLVLAALMCTTATAKLTVSGGGYLATIIMSFIAVTGWKILSTTFDSTPLQKATSLLWHLMQPVLVGVIGADIDFKDWSLSRLGLHTTSIAIGLLARSISVILTTLRTPFTWKERLFLAIAWLPKGTLQAALAPMAFERAKKEDNPSRIELALDVVRISVFSIVLMAPIGAFAMSASGPFLLNKITVEQQQQDRQLSYLRIVNLQPVRKRKQYRPTMESVKEDVA